MKSLCDEGQSQVIDYFYYKYGGPCREIFQVPNTSLKMHQLNVYSLQEASHLSKTFLYLPLMSCEFYFEFFYLYMLIFAFLFYAELPMT